MSHKSIPGGVCMRQTKILFILLCLFNTRALSESRESFPLANLLVEPENIGDVLSSHHSNPDFPESLQGIWWMQDTPSASVVSLANSDWDQNKRCLKVKLAGPYTYTYENKVQSDFEIKAYLNGQVRYDVCLDETYQKATLQLIYDLNIYGQKISITIPRFILDYTMQYSSNKTHWLRSSKILGIPAHTYKLTRIISKEDQIEDTFEDFLENHNQPNRKLLVITNL